MKKLSNVHPGEILYNEFLKPLGITAYRISKDLNIPQTRISEIIKGNRRITTDTALRLSKYFGNSAKFWLGLQNDYDIEEEQKEKQNELAEIKRIVNVAQFIFETEDRRPKKMIRNYTPQSATHN